MSIGRTIVQKGSPEVEEGEAITATFLPGTLLTRTIVAGVVSFAPGTLNGAHAAPTVAMERGEMGIGVDNAQQSLGTPTAVYAIGDQVKVGVPGTSVAPLLGLGLEAAFGWPTINKGSDKAYICSSFVCGAPVHVRQIHSVTMSDLPW